MAPLIVVQQRPELCEVGLAHADGWHWLFRGRDASGREWRLTIAAGQPASWTDPSEREQPIGSFAGFASWDPAFDWRSLVAQLPQATPEYELYIMITPDETIIKVEPDNATVEMCFHRDAHWTSWSNTYVTNADGIVDEGEPIEQAGFDRSSALHSTAGLRALADGVPARYLAHWALATLRPAGDSDAL